MKTDPLQFKVWKCNSFILILSVDIDTWSVTKDLNSDGLRRPNFFLYYAGGVVYLGHQNIQQTHVHVHAFIYIIYHPSVKSWGKMRGGGVIH